MMPIDFRPIAPKESSRSSGGGPGPDLTGRQFAERHEDLVINIPDGAIFVTRTFAYGRWSVRATDRLYSMGRASGGPTAGTPLVLAGYVYTLNGQPLPDASASDKMGVVPLSRVLPGVYRPSSETAENFIKHPDGTFTWSDGEGNSRAYDIQGRLVSRAYYGLPVATFQYDLPNHAETVTDRLGRVVLYLKYNDRGDLISARDDRDLATPESARPMFTYRYETEAPFRLTEVVDASGTTFSYGYEDGRIKTITTTLPALPASDPAQSLAPPPHVVTYTYKAKGPAASLSVPDYRGAPPAAGQPWPDAPAGMLIGDRSGYGYAISGFLTGLSHDTGESETYVYKFLEDTQVYHTRVTDGAGRVEESVFGVGGALKRKYVAGITVFAAEQSGRVRSIVRGKEKTIEEFNEQGQVVRRVNPDGGVETFTYHPTLRLRTSHTNPVGLVTTATYDDYGNLLDFTQTPPAAAPGEPAAPPARSTIRTYESNSRRVATETLPDGRTWICDYYLSSDTSNLHRAELLKRRYLQSDPSRQALYDYDHYGRVSVMTDALGRETRYAYDSSHRVVVERNALGYETRYRYQGPNLIEQEIGVVPASGSAVGSALPPLQRGRVTRYSYDSRGRRLAEYRVAADGSTYRYQAWTYDLAGRIATETNALNQTTSRTYDRAGFLASITRPGPGGVPSVTTYEHDAWGRQTKLVDPMNNVTRTVIGTNGKPASVTEACDTALARTTTVTYDLAGRVLTKVISGKEMNASGTMENVSYTESKRYNAFGDPVFIDELATYPISITYDGAGRLSGVTDARGLTAISTYHPDSGLLHQVTMDKVTGGTRTLYSYDYDRVGNRISVSDGGYNKRYFAYDALNRLTHESIAYEGYPSSSWWDRSDEVMLQIGYTRFGEKDFERRPTYDPVGKSTTYADTDYSYDDYGRLATMTSPGGLTTTYEYDLADNIVSASYPVPSTSGRFGEVAETWIRDPAQASLVTAHIDTSGYVRQFGYDLSSRRIREVNPQGGVTTTLYDGLDRVDTETDAFGRQTRTLAYNLQDEPLRIQYPDHTVAAPRIEKRSYDRHGKLLTREGAGGDAVRFTYDDVGNRQTLTTKYGAGAGTDQTTTWEYNELNLVAAKIYPDQKRWEYTYDGAGRLASRLDGRNRLTQYYYYPSGLPYTVTYPSDPSVTFTYDQQLRPRTMQDGSASASTRWTYDAAGRLSTEFQARSGRTLTFTPDDHDERTRLLVSGGSAGSWTVDYTYDASGRLATLRDGRHPGTAPFTYGYPAARPLAGLSGLPQAPPPANPATGQDVGEDQSTLTTPFGQLLRTTRDALGRTKAVDFSPIAANPAPTLYHRYTFDDANQRATEDTPGWDRDYHYDDKLQLTSANTSAGANDSYAYTYDPIGNRLSATLSAPGTLLQPSGAQAVTTGYTPGSLNTYAAIRIPAGSSSPLVPTYDDNGNQLTAPALPYSSAPSGLTYTYDDENRLLTAATATNWERYIYDGIGRRVERIRYVGLGTTVESSTRYVYDGSRVVEELSGTTNSVLRGYVRGLDISDTWEGAGGIGGLLAFLRPSGGTYAASAYFHDANGNVTALLDASGSVEASYRYTPFGESLLDPGSGTVASANPYRFSAKECDSLTGNYYYGYRYYNPATGRWLNRDPLGEAGGMNLYAAFYNDGVNKLDPDGRNPAVAVGIAEALAKQMAEALVRQLLDDLLRQLLDCDDYANLYKLGNWQLIIDEILAGKRAIDQIMRLRDILKTLKNRDYLQLNAKTGPKPKGTGPHNETIDRRIQELKDQGHTHTHGGSKKEEVIPTPGGDKSSRRPDITTIDPSGNTYRENVGRTKADGTPVTREVSAANDIEQATGTRPVFTPYDR